MSILQKVTSMIAMEVGNSRVKFGLFRDGHQISSADLPICVEHKAVSLDSHTLPWDELQELFRRDVPLNRQSPLFVAASVNPAGLERVLLEWPIANWPKPTVLRSSAELPIVNRTHYPEKVGTDRLLKAIAANVLRRPDYPIIVVDSGTATTVDWITDQGEFSGGAILPGLALASKALHTYTAQLPLIEMSQLNSPPPAIGRETISALESGLYWGHIGAVRELIQRMSVERGLPLPNVLVTGGGGSLLAGYLEAATYRPALTLEGLAVAARTLSNLQMP
ncbi:MAG: transcriptional activator, Baf family [Planctomycetaceae bacterium]|nr:transcriptional activator, Baf family [Planctomycetaceae bacterium]